jgi:ATP-dependent helicase/nuclease subunit B
MAKRSPVNILIGPARSGKAALIRRRYLDRTGKHDPSRVLLLVPTAERRITTLEALVRDSGRGALLRTEVWTFPQYAEHVLDCLGTPARRTTAIQRFALLQEAVSVCRGDKTLRHMLPIADTPGFLDTLDRFIHTLKTHEVHPEVLSRKTIRGLPALKDAAAIYTRYQELLTRFGLYDDAGLFWQTKDALTEAPETFDWPEVVLADGFQDFSPPERDILKALHARGAELTITLPCVRPRPRIFTWTQRTLDALVATFGDCVEIADTASADEVSSPVTQLSGRLFDDEATALPTGAAGAVSFIEAAGCTREVEAIARRLKQLIRHEGRRPSDIAIITRRGDPYAELIARVFPRYGLPLGDAPAVSLARSPLPRWLLALLRLPVDNFRYSDVAAVLRSPYFSCEGFDIDEKHLGDADRLLFTAGVFEGLAGLTGVLRERARNQRRRAEHYGDDADHADACRVEAEAADVVAVLLDGLAERLSPLGKASTRSEFATEVLELIDDLHLADRAAAGDDLALVARDLATLEALRETLQEMQELEAWTGNRPMSLEAHVAELQRAMQSVSVTPSLGPGGGVRLMDVHRSRALSFPVVVLPGLNEGTWPGAASERLFETGRRRPVLEALGVPVTDPQMHAAEERFLFYMAATRAAEQLILSRPASDEDGRPQLPSQFWDETLRIAALGGDDPVIRVVSSRDAEVELDQAGSRDEVLRITLASLSAGGKMASDRLAALLAADEAAAEILDSVAVVRERESAKPFGPFDGVVSAPEIIEQLSTEFPGKTVLSISRLEDYASCPFRFFATTVLRLRQWQPPEEYFLEADVGLLYHDALRDFFRLRQQRGPGATRLADADADELRTDMLSAIERVFAERDVGSLPALWAIQKEEITERLLAYVAQEADRCRAAPLAVEPTLFEWGFGLSDADGDADPRSAAAPLVIDSPHGPVRLRGRVDRVDLLCRDKTVEGLAVVDYKSGSKPSGLTKALKTGRMLQLPLYLLAVENALGDLHKARGMQAMYAYVRQLETVAPIDFVGGGKKEEAAREIVEAARTTVVATIAAVRRGQFPPTPNAGCPSYCEYRELCRMARWRVERKLQEGDRASDA